MSIKQEIKKHLASITVGDNEVNHHTYDLEYTEKGIMIKFEGHLTMIKEAWKWDIIPTL